MDEHGAVQCWSTGRLHRRTGLSTSARFREGTCPRPRRRRRPEKVAIINHPDVRRMLMDIRSQTEAMRALAYDTAVQFDIAKRHTDAHTRNEAKAKLDLHTDCKGMVDGPRGRTHLDRGSNSRRHGLHRRNRCRPTLSRFRSRRFTKVPTASNRATSWVGRYYGTAERPHAAISKKCGNMPPPQRCSTHLFHHRRKPLDGPRRACEYNRLVNPNGGKSPALAFAGADAYLDLFGKTAGGAMMARAAVAAQSSLSNGSGNPSFYETKLTTARFYAIHVLPKTAALASEITRGCGRRPQATGRRVLNFRKPSCVRRRKRIRNTFRKRARHLCLRRLRDTASYRTSR